MTKKILIIGNSASEHALANKLKEEGHEIHVAPGNTGIMKSAVCVDIRPNSISELIDYVMENDIDLTIPSSDAALKNGITNFFKKNNLSIFAPSKSICDLLYDKTVLKKVLYRLGISTPKFGIFEKPAMTLEYLKNINIPFVIKTSHSSSCVVLTSIKTAKNIVNTCFEKQESKVIIEDYIQGIPFCFYAITDGYKAISVGSSRIYRYALEGDGGQLTNGMGACSPCSQLSLKNEQSILNSIIYPLLEYFQSIGTPYLGIMGIEAILTNENKISVIGINPFMSNSDCCAVLNNIDTNLYDLFNSCIIGSFSDDIDEIPLKSIYSTSVTLNCVNKNNNDNNSVTGLELLNEDTKINFYPNVKNNIYTELLANYGQNLVITCSAGTRAYATSKTYDEVDNIKFAGKYFRKDIGKTFLH